MMLRIRRYRALLVVAIFVSFGFYHLTKIHPGENQSFAVDQLQGLGHHVPDEPPFKVSATADVDIYLLQSASHSPTPTQPPTSLEYPEALPLSSPVWSSGEDLAQNGNRTESDKEDILDDFSPPERDRMGMDQQSLILERPHWMPRKEQYPVPSSSVIHLPTGRPRPIPLIQHLFATETSIEKERNEKRLSVIKEAFKHAWGGYKEYAMPHDELTPVSGSFKDPFNGWSATLVDTLDTLWIMDLKDEFEEAVEVAKNIDFTTSIREDIPLFETVIRYLGGLIAAHDISSGKYPVLLEKAVQLAEILMGAFDTPNRMPVTYYPLAPQTASQPQRAGSNTVLSELGSLSLEFTRLAQLTQNDKYYDAIARITNELEAWQNRTSLPGLWPVFVDASGCKKPDPLSAQLAYSASHAPQSLFPPVNNMSTVMMNHTKISSQNQEEKGTGSPKIPSLHKRQIDDAGILYDEEPAHPPSERMEDGTEFSSSPEVGQRRGDFTVDGGDCQHHRLASPSNGNPEIFTMGGMADSAYEYLPKEWLLLGGLNDQYESMFRNAMKVVRDRLLYRPMTKTGRDVLFIGAMKISVPSPGHDRVRSSGTDLKYEGMHLTCFAGGMFALAAKVFGINDDLEVARKLTDGCVWAYESTTTGIMPEVFHLVPCDDRKDCTWNETKWWQALDPYHSQREGQAEAWYERQTLLKPETSVIEAELPDKPSYSDMQVLPTADAQPAMKNGPGKRAASASDMTSEGSFRKSQSPKQKEALGADDELYGTPRTLLDSPEATSGDDIPTASSIFAAKALASHEEFVQARIKEERLPIGFTDIESRKYILRPEAIESVFIMYRVTGNEYWREQGWKMFTAIQTYTMTKYGNSAITDVTSEAPPFSDGMESFWLAETLKYFYLLYSDPDLVNLDEYVLNTEAHPFKRPK